MIGVPVYGWAKLGSDGLIDWSTFTTIPQGSGWVYTFRLPCQCGNSFCGQHIYSRDDLFFNMEFYELGDGDITFHFYYDTIPVKFQIFKNGVLQLDTGYGGLSSYQTALDTFLAGYGLPPEVINPAPPTSFTFPVTNTDVVRVEVISIVRFSNYYYYFDCVDSGAVDCVLTEWSAWTPWSDNGDGTESRSRTRSVLVQPENGGAPCGDLIETQTRQKISQDCVLSEWSEWSAWTPNNDNFQTESRYRTRTVITPAENGGAPCGPLIETETRPIEN